MRASSDYDKDTGYAPLFHSFLADWPRISSGHIADVMFMAVLSKSLGRGVKKGEPRQTRTIALAVEELAAIVNAKNPPLRSVERELARWHKEKIADVKSEGKGSVSIELLFRGWEALPDFKSDIVEMPITEEETPDTETVDETKPGNQRVTGKRPVRLQAGARSKPFEVKVGVKEFQAQVEGPVDCEVSAVIKAGRFVTVVRFPDDWLEKAAKSISTSNETNNLDSPPRHGRRGDGRKAAAVDDPRAGELIRLFDPLLGKSGAVLLAMDSASLGAACEAVQDCDHDYLVHFVMQRAERGPIRKPQTVAVICKEALASWRASRVLDGTRLQAKSPLTDKGKRVAENLRRIHGK